MSKFAIVVAAVIGAGLTQAVTTTTHPTSPKASVSTQPANPVPVVRFDRRRWLWRDSRPAGT